MVARNLLFRQSGFGGRDWPTTLLVVIALQYLTGAGTNEPLSFEEDGFLVKITT